MDDDLPVFLLMFVRLLAAFTLGAWLHALATPKPEKEMPERQPAAMTTAAHVPAKPAPTASIPAGDDSR